MYNFDITSDRRNVNSLKWEYDDVLPMWVADMDFDTLPEVKEAIIKRVERGALGYTNTPDYYYEAFRDFFKRHHNVDIDINNMIFSTGVVPAISSIVRKLTSIGDKIMVLTPTYNIFFNSIVNNKRIPVECDLVYDGENYNINWDDFENKAKDIRMLILCNPQNPVGRIWSKDELARIGEICKKNDVIVLSDEIHCDIVTPGKNYCPFMSASDICKDISVTCISASKCFNLAGLQGAVVVVNNKEMYRLVNRGLNTDEVAEGNAFVYDAFSAALNNGDIWLKEVNEYIYKNKLYLKVFIENNLSMLKYHFGDATYLAWVDVSGITDDSNELCEFLKNNAKVYFSYGEEYGKSFKKFIRINLATSLENVKEGLNRLLIGINKYLNK